MKPKNEKAESGGELPKAAREEEQPLLRALVAQAQHRGDTLRKLAKTLGVTYARLSQWRRNESDFANANAQVIEEAARYLGIPAILAMVLAKRIRLAQLVWPARGGLDERLERELDRLRKDPFIGGLVPADLAAASQAVQLFVAFLYHELTGPDSRQEGWRWLQTLHEVAAGDLEARLDADRLRASSAERTGLF